MVRRGDRVKLDCTVKLEDGTVVGSFARHEPLELVVGEAKLLPGIEDAVVGMENGETKTVKLSSSEALGASLERQPAIVGRDQLPPGLKPDPGEQLEIRLVDGESTLARITEVTDSHVRLDASPPLAKGELVYELHVTEGS